MTGWLTRVLPRLGHRWRGPRTLLLWWAAAVALAATVLTVAIARDSRSELELDATQRAVIDTLESVLLHDSLVPQHGRVVNQFDARGFVAGIGDFATADGSALEVVTTYTARVGDNPLARVHLDTLHQLAQQHSGETTGLVGFPDAWQRASLDPVFRTAQVDIMESRDFQPALQRARDLGLVTPLGLAIIYDSLLQHGLADQPDGLPELIARTDARLGGSPRTVSEHDWLAAFLDERRTVLLGPANPANLSIWPLSTGRLDVLSKLLAAHRDDLAPPLEVNPYGRTHIVSPGGDGPGSTNATDPDSLGIPPTRGSSKPSPSSHPPAATKPATEPKTSTPARTTGPTAATPRTSARPGPVTPQAGLIVHIVNVNSGKPFGVERGSFEDGAAIRQNGDPGAAQQWRITVSPAGCFALLNMRSAKALDNPDGSGEWGQSMQQWTVEPTGNPNQSWCFDPAGNGVYTIRNLASGLVLDLQDGGYGDGNSIQQWGAEPPSNPNQNWILELVR